MIGWFALNVPSGLSLYYFSNTFFTTAIMVYLKKLGGECGWWGGGYNGRVWCFGLPKVGLGVSQQRGACRSSQPVLSVIGAAEDAHGVHSNSLSRHTVWC